MLTRADLQVLADTRLAEARALVDGGFFSGGYYIAGYAAEFALKALIAKTFVGDAIPDKDIVNKSYTHDLEKLMTYAGLEPELKTQRLSDFELGTNWEITKKWNESSRYAIASEDKARQLIEALADPESGVFTWIRRRW